MRGVVERAIPVLVALLAALTVAVLAVRSVSAAHDGALVQSTGGEELAIYGIWKIQNGHPLYEWPDRGSFAHTPHNFLFYESYAKIADLLGLRDRSMMVWGRFLTLVLAGLGAVGQWLLSRRLVRPRRGRDVDLLLAGVSILVWFGTSYMSWWSLTLRPDVGGAALGIFGLIACLTAYERRSPWLAALSSLAFFAAWGFKQTFLWIFLAVVAAGLLRRGVRREAIVLAVPWAALVGVSLAVGGAVYRENVIYAHLVSPNSVGGAVRELGKAVAPSLFIWLFWLIVPLGMLARRRAQGAWSAFEGWPLRIVLAAGVLSLVGDAATLGKSGSSRNVIMEAFVVSGLLSGVALVAVVRASAEPRLRPVRAAAAVLLASMLVLPAAQLAVPDALGRIDLVSEADHRQRQQIADELGRVPKPLFTWRIPYNLPWFSTGDRFPAIVINGVYYFPALARGEIRGGGVEGLVRRHGVRALVVERSDPVYEAGVAAGFREAPQLVGPGLRAVGAAVLVDPRSEGRT